MNILGRWNLVSYLIERYQLEGWASLGVIFGGIVLCMMIPYLLGSLNFGVIISRKAYRDDVRTHGSGNAGTTNMLRTYGKGAAALTLLGDMLKAVVAVAFGYFIFTYRSVIDIDNTPTLVTDKIGAAVAGLFVMLGHMFPCYFRFKGGKGVATLAMVVLMINPIVFAILMLIFVIIVACTKYVSLGSVMGALLYPVILYAFEGKRGSGTACALAVVMGLLVVFMHRENIKRLREGKESKLSFKKKKPAEGVAEDGKPATGTADGSATGKAGKKSEKAKAEPAEPEREYQFVHCPGCGHLIPQSRKKCGYCNTVNPQYVPDPDSGSTDGEKKKRKK